MKKNYLNKKKSAKNNQVDIVCQNNTVKKYPKFIPEKLQW